VQFLTLGDHQYKKSLFEDLQREANNAEPVKMPSHAAMPVPVVPGMRTYATLADGRCFWRGVVTSLLAQGVIVANGDRIRIVVDNIRVKLALFFLDNLHMFWDLFENFYLPLLEKPVEETVEAAKMRAFVPTLFDGTPVVLEGEGIRSKAVQYALALVKGVWGGEFEARLIAEKFAAVVHIRSSAFDGGVAAGCYDASYRPINSVANVPNIWLGRSCDHYCVYLAPGKFRLPEGVALLERQQDAEFQTVTHKRDATGGGTPPATRPTYLEAAMPTSRATTQSLREAAPLPGPTLHVKETVRAPEAAPAADSIAAGARSRVSAAPAPAAPTLPHIRSATPHADLPRCALGEALPVADGVFWTADV
jgi:hypothetical protein